MALNQSICPEDLSSFRRAYEENTLSQVSTRAASKTSLEEICYDLPHASRMNHKFSVDIPTLPACAQNKSGRCWIFASMNMLREKIAKDLNLSEFELSQSYISFYDHLEKANSFLEHVIETAADPLDDRYVSMIMESPIGDGGWWEYFVGLCKKYGVVPKESMPETYQSSNTSSMNWLLKMQLRKDAIRLRSEIAAGTSEEQIQSMKKDMLSTVYNLLAICLGNPPEHFDFEYVDKDRVYHADRDLTPLGFYEKYLGRDLEQIVSLINAPVASIPFYKTYVTSHEESIHGAYHSKRLNLPMDEFKSAVIRQLQAGDPVWFVCDCDYYGNRKEGIWDTGLYDYETPFGLDLEISKGDALEYRQCTLNHAMLLTGVNLVDGKADKWKIQNSWGTENGDKGYFIMSDEWFDRYVFTASVDLRYLTPEQQELFRQEPVDMPLWNILG